MLDRIRDLFRSPPDAEHPAEEVDEASEAHDIRLAACALLLELAYADDEFTDDERDHLSHSIRRHYGLDSEEADELVRLAEAQRASAVDLWQFTNLIKRHYSLGQKMVLAEIMWGLVYADGELAGKEDYLMRRISNLLDLEVGYLSTARKRVEEGDSGSVLREPD